MYLVDNDLNDKDPCRKSFSMSPPQLWLPRLPKRHRRKAVVCLVGGLCFLFGLAVPFMFGRSLGGTQGSSRSRLRSSSIQLDDYKLDGVLSDLFISVKTTKKYHHPRLVILLETWVTLVKSQARRRRSNAVSFYHHVVHWDREWDKPSPPDSLTFCFRPGSSPTARIPKSCERPTGT